MRPFLPRAGALFRVTRLDLKSQKNWKLDLVAGFRLELKSVDNESTMLPLHQPAKENPLTSPFILHRLAASPHIAVMTPRRW